MDRSHFLLQEREGGERLAAGVGWRRGAGGGCGRGLAGRVKVALTCSVTTTKTACPPSAPHSLGLKDTPKPPSKRQSQLWLPLSCSSPLLPAVLQPAKQRKSQSFSKCGPVDTSIKISQHSTKPMSPNCPWGAGLRDSPWGGWIRPCPGTRCWALHRCPSQDGSTSVGLGGGAHSACLVGSQHLPPWAR